MIYIIFKINKCKYILLSFLYSILRSELDTTHANLEEARNEMSYLESLVQRYEQRVFDLEELEVELREKLSLLEGAVHFAIWWNTILMNQGFRQPSRPMIIDLSPEMGKDIFIF